MIFYAVAQRKISSELNIHCFSKDCNSYFSFPADLCAERKLPFGAWFDAVSAAVLVFLIFAHRQLIAAVVIGVVGMALHPIKCNLMKGK